MLGCQCLLVPAVAAGLAKVLLGENIFLLSLPAGEASIPGSEPKQGGRLSLPGAGRVAEDRGLVLNSGQGSYLSEVLSRVWRAK